MMPLRWSPKVIPTRSDSVSFALRLLQSSDPSSLLARHLLTTSIRVFACATCFHEGRPRCLRLARQSCSQTLATSAALCRFKMWQSLPRICISREPQAIPLGTKLPKFSSRNKTRVPAAPDWQASVMRVICKLWGYTRLVACLP